MILILALIIAVIALEAYLKIKQYNYTTRKEIDHIRAMRGFEMTPIHLAALLSVLAMIAIPSGCLYNNAERQAKDIKWCESVGARWQYHSMTKQINCVPSRSYRDENN